MSLNVRSSSWSMLLISLCVGIALAAPTLKPPTCEFDCGNKECVNLEDRCDNVKDCTNGMDEVNCNYLHECPPNTFMCRSGECLPRSQKCNGISECSDGSDEKLCRVIPQMTFYPSAADFEHRESHAELDKIGFATTPKLIKPKCSQNNATIYFTNDENAIYQSRAVHENAYATTLMHKKPAESGSIRAISVDYPHNQLLYVMERMPSQIRIIDADRADRILLEDLHHRFSAVAKDWITGNLYYTEDGIGLGVCIENKKTINGKELMCMQLIDEPTTSRGLRYRDLILHPKRGMMMWIQDEPLGVLKIAGMDGLKLRTLSSFEHVHAIAFDYEKERLYVAEGDEIDIMDIQTLQRQTFANVQPSALAVYNCELYYVDRKNEQLKKYVDGESDIHVAALSGYRFSVVMAGDNGTVGHEVARNPCDDINCTEFCTLTESALETSARCLCTICEEEEEDTDVTEGALSWFISLALVSMLVFFAFSFLVIFYRLCPALNNYLDNLISGGDKMNDSNISVGYNNTAFKPNTSN